MLQRLLVLISLLAVTACAVNPVTGKTELSFVSEAQELQLGEQYYAPSQQMQGGDYVIDPDLTAYVRGVGGKLAAVSDRDLPYEFAVLNSSIPNAWALPGGKIAINRGLLLEMDSEAELAAVLSHEIVHAAARHGAKAQTRGILLQGAVLGTALATGRDTSDALIGGAGAAAALITQKYGRDAELESDFYGIQYMSRAGYDTQGAVRLQEAFVRLSKGRNQDFFSSLFSSHPPSRERVNKNIETAATLPPGGVVGRERYQQNIALLKRRKPAYDAYDHGRKALMDENLLGALRFAQQAINEERNEAQFHALRGDIRFKQERYKDAKINYDRAIERHPGFFYFYLQRGSVENELANYVAARQDFEESIKLLPTANAYYGLGVSAEKIGDIPGAIKYYETAAGANNETGQAARIALLRLDLANNPGRYLQLAAGLNDSGYLVIRIGNPNPVPIGNIGLAIRYRGASGGTRDTSGRFPHSLDANQQADYTTRLGPFGSDNDYAVRITGAQVID